MAMHCPSCKTGPMNAINFHGQEVDTCSHCKGLWFDNGELNDALKTAANESQYTNMEDTFGQALGVSLRNCGKCNCRLTRRYLLDDFHVEIDSCPSCSGVWIDQHEREKVINSPKMRAALAELNKNVSVASWLFQFFTTLPVEYNLKTKSVPIVTYSLLLLNMLIFFYGLFQANLDIIFEPFALIPAQVLRGENTWTLISHMFLHGGWLHILMNMYFLFIIGDNLEDALGKGKFLLLYLSGGILSALIYMFSDPTSTTYMIGASGAISALFAMYLLWFRHASLSFMIIVYQKKVSPQTFFIIWLALNLIGMAVGDDSVAYMAHFGGFAAGLIFGFALKKQVLKNNPMLAMLNANEVKIAR